MGRKVDGKKMNQKQKRFLERQENETNKRDDNEAETQDSKQLDGTHDSSFKRVSDQQEIEAHKRLMKRMFSLCVNSPLHGIGIVLPHLHGENKSTNNSNCQLPIPTLNVSGKEH